MAAASPRAVLCSTHRHLERQRGRLPTEGEAFGWTLDHAITAWEADDPDPQRAGRRSACTPPWGCARGSRPWSAIARGT